MWKYTADLVQFNLVPNLRRNLSSLEQIVEDNEGNGTTSEPCTGGNKDERFLKSNV